MVRALAGQAGEARSVAAAEALIAKQVLVMALFPLTWFFMCIYN
jgi:hypothetical protein